MDARPDLSTSSGSGTGTGWSESQDGWSFLNQGLNNSDGVSTLPTHDAQAPRSQPPSSYLRSSQSSISPLPNGDYTYNGSRSSLSRNLPSASTGAQSTTTIPSQPVLSCINSAPANNHNNHFVGRTRRPIKTMDGNGLPALEEFSLQGILSAIYEDIEAPLNTISEALGRSRFALADQYEAQMPPQGEIIMQNPSENDGTFHLSDDALAGAEPMVADLDSSLVDGSNPGSAAYGLLERLQTVPRPVRIQSDVVVASARDPRPTDTDALLRTHSSPSAVQSEPEPASAKPVSPVITEGHGVALRESTSLPADHGPARAIVSEMYISAEASGVQPNAIPTGSEAGRHYPLYSHDDTGLFQTTSFVRSRSDTRRRYDGWVAPALTSWFTGRYRNSDRDAEARLRALLRR